MFYGRKAADLKKDNASEYINLGFALEGLNQDDKAAKQFDIACQLNPNNGQAFAQAGRMAKKMGNLEKAFACFERFTNSEPDNPAGHWELAWTCETRRLGRGKEHGGGCGQLSD